MDKLLETRDVVVPRSLRHRLEQEITETSPCVIGRFRDLVVAHHVTGLFNIQSA